MVLRALKDPAPAEWLTHSGIAWDVLATFGPHTLFPAHARLRYAPDDGETPRPEIPPRPLGEQGDGPVIAELCDMLAADTTTPQLCYFCLWEGGRMSTRPSRRVHPSWPSRIAPTTCSPAR